MDGFDAPAIEGANDLYAELREQQDIELLREGRLDSTFIDASRQSNALSIEEFMDESGD